MNAFCILGELEGIIFPSSSPFDFFFPNVKTEAIYNKKKLTMNSLQRAIGIRIIRSIFHSNYSSGEMTNVRNVVKVGKTKFLYVSKLASILSNIRDDTINVQSFLRVREMLSNVTPEANYMLWSPFDAVSLFTCIPISSTI